jgi:ubiquinone/menaquinone biosynthesis C-methylase UbiE
LNKNIPEVCVENDKTTSLYAIEVKRINENVFLTEEAIEQYSNYSLKFEEKSLAPKYFKEGSTVLDLACGAGRTTVRLYEMGYKVKGVDLSEVLLNVARKRFPYIEFDVGNYCSIQEEDESYDNILISFNGLDYAYPESEREKAIAECRRALKRGGHLMFSTHNIKWLHGLLFPWNNDRMLLLKNMFNAFKEQKYIYEKGTGLWTYYASSEYVINQVEKAGFKFKEKIGNKRLKKLRGRINSEILDKYLCPWINYVFEKL